MIEAGSWYVAVGSSFAAGPGIEPVLDPAAGRSARNYPHLVADALGLRLTDVSRSGARTAHILAEPQDGAPPQIEAVGADARLVTVTVGGNDLGYVGGLFAAAARGTLSRPVRALSGRVGDVVAGHGATASRAQVDGLAAALTEIVIRVMRRAPTARVLLVDYLTLVGPTTGSGPALPLTATALDRARATADGLGEAFARAADASTAELVTVSEPSLDHAIGAHEPWVTGFRIRHRSRGPAPFHPTEAGMQAVADLVIGAVRS